MADSVRVDLISVPYYGHITLLGTEGPVVNPVRVAHSKVRELVARGFPVFAHNPANRSIKVRLNLVNIDTVWFGPSQPEPVRTKPYVGPSVPSKSIGIKVVPKSAGTTIDFKNLVQGNAQPVASTEEVEMGDMQPEAPKEEETVIKLDESKASVPNLTDPEIKKVAMNAPQPAKVMSVPTEVPAPAAVVEEEVTVQAPVEAETSEAEAAPVAETTQTTAEATVSEATFKRKSRNQRRKEARAAREAAAAEAAAIEPAPAES